MPNKDSRILLTDNYTSPLKIVESKANIEGPYTNAVIATLYGVLSDFGHVTRNNRLYSKELWEKVLSSDIVKEMLDTKTMFGEPDHPMDVENRLDVHIPYISHIIREPKIDYKDNTVKGYLDVLDTPYGRIIKTLIDYGCTLGVSSRGSGELISQGDKDLVDPSQYAFITWDIVARPSNIEARVHEIDTVHLDPKSSNKTVYELLEIQVDKFINEHDTRSLRVTKGLLENTNIPNKNKIIEKINRNTSSITYRSPKGNRQFIDEAYKKLISCKREYSLLESKCGELEKQLSDAQDTISGLRSQKDNLQSMVIHYMGKSSKGSSTARALSEGMIHDHSSEFEDMATDISSIVSKLDTIQESIKSLKEDSESNDDYYEEAMELGRELQSCKRELEEVSNEKRSITEKYSDLIESYLSLRCQSLGLNESMVKKEFRGKLHKYDQSDIDAIIRDIYKGSSSSQITLPESAVTKETNEPVMIAESINTNNDSDLQSLVGLISTVRAGKS